MGGKIDATRAESSVHQNVDAIVDVHSAELRALSSHQRAIEKMVDVISRPAFLFCVALAIALWIGINIGLHFSGRKLIDPYPFGWLQTTIGILALMMTCILVITQNRQGKVAEMDAHLDLQISLLVDQKVGKVIQLLEEIRSDSPHLRDRRDREAESMQIAADPGHMASVIAEKMNLGESQS